MNINQSGLHRLNTSVNLENPGYILTVVEPAAQFTDIHKTERKNKQTKQMQFRKWFKLLVYFSLMNIDHISQRKV